jgi:hypothetical protein
MRCEALESGSILLAADEVGYIALKLPPLVLDGMSSVNNISAQPIANLSPRVVAALERLVNLVTQLRGSAKEWLNEDSPSPDVLLPYVLDETQDVLDAVRLEITDALEVQAFPPTTPTSIRQDYLWLKALTPWLLWTIARCSYDSMKLLEGRIAQVTLPGHTWRTGILRLVSIVAIHTPTFAYCIDLATYQQVPESLPDDRLIQLKGEFCQQPAFVKDFIAQLTQEIQQTTPAIVPFFQNTPIRLLIPGQSWQDGSIQLQLAFEFIPTPPSRSAEAHGDPRPTPPPPLPALQFTNPTWTQTHQQIVTRHCQRSCTNLLSDLRYLSVQTDPCLRLLTDVYQVSDRLHQGWTIASRQFSAQSWQIEQLAARIMWCCLHSAYDVMQMMTGIEAVVLQPQAEVSTGTLQFVLTLSVQTPETDWQWDIMTGQMAGQPLPPPSFHQVALSPEALIQTPTLQGHQPILLSSLEQTLWQKIEQAVPELLLLVQGAEIKVQIDSLEWQPAIAKLQGQMAFIPLMV